MLLFFYWSNLFGAIGVTIKCYYVHKTCNRIYRSHLFPTPYKQNGNVFEQAVQQRHTAKSTFLADRTNGRAIATLLRLSVCRL